MNNTPNNVNTQKDFLYLLIDEINDGILFATDSIDAACAMTLFSPRISLRPMETHKSYLRADLAKIDYRDLKTHYAWKPAKGKREIPPLAKEEITPEYIAYRNEIARRTRFQDMIKCLLDVNVVATSVETPLLSNYAPNIGYELLQCKPAEDFFTTAVQAYAYNSSISNSDAYYELKLHMDNLSSVQLTNLAVYIKFRNLLNQAAGDLDSQKTIVDKLLTINYKTSQL